MNGDLFAQRIRNPVYLPRLKGPNVLCPAARFTDDQDQYCSISGGKSFILLLFLGLVVVSS